jgi:hypothetical protein
MDFFYGICERWYVFATFKGDLEQLQQYITMAVAQIGRVMLQTVWA